MNSSFALHAEKLSHPILIPIPTSVREWDLDSVKYFSSLTAHNILPFSRHSSILNFVPISNHTYIHVLAVWSFGKRSFLTVVVGGNKIPAVCQCVDSDQDPED